MVFSPIPFQPDLLPPNREQIAEQEPTESAPVRSLRGLKSAIAESLKQIFFPHDKVSWFILH